MPHLLLFGPGYSGGRIATALTAEGWRVQPIGRAGRPDFSGVTHILSTVPPILPGTGRGTAGAAGGGGGSLSNATPEAAPLHQPAAGLSPRAGEDPVLAAHAPAIAASGAWLGYLSSSGVYGDAGGAWVDESAPLRGRRDGRIAADQAWLALGARVFRLPGIYGPGRSPLDRVAAGQAHRVEAPGQVFSRVHVDDIVAGVLAAIERGPAGAYNLADDLPAPQNDVVAAAASLLGLPPPPFVALESLSPAAQAFYGENRRVANGKAKRLLGWQPTHRDYRAGLRALIATASPTSVNSAPPSAAAVQR